MTFTGRTGTALLVALVVSVCVNLLLAGVMIGGRWHHGGPWWHEIPEQARPVMKQTFEANKPEFDARRDAVQQARQKVADVLKVDPIDQAKLDQALAELSQQNQAMEQFTQQVMIQVARQLPPELRAQMADRWANDRFRRKRDDD
jgi:Spy/CpxP family protein refolding chaperone